MSRLSLRIAIPVAGLGLILAGTAPAQMTASATAPSPAVSRPGATLSDFERLAAAGDAKAAEQAGRILYEGRAPDGQAVARDLDRARGYLSQAVKAGSPTARAMLDRMAPSADGGYVPGPHGC